MEINQQDPGIRTLAPNEEKCYYKNASESFTTTTTDNKTRHSCH